VSTLPPKQRGAITLRFAGDLAYADIASVLDISEAAARQNVRAGLQRLRTSLGEETPT
jgi:DNA-directed RNA polymerase specialized sigma24 family protein